MQKNEEFVNVEKQNEGVPYKAGVEFLKAGVMVAIRADILFVVSMVIQFMSKVGLPHWMALKHIMGFLKDILDFKLCLRGKDIDLRDFCNADWAGHTNDRQSITQYVYFIGVKVILWKCKKITIIALSTIEAEYMAIEKRFFLGKFWQMWDMCTKD